MDTTCRACGRGALAFRGEHARCNTCDARFARVNGQLSVVLAAPPERFVSTRRGKATTITIRRDLVSRALGAVLLAGAVVVPFLGSVESGIRLVATVAFAFFGVLLSRQERIAVDARYIERRLMFPSVLSSDGRVEVLLAEQVEPKSRRTWHHLRVRCGDEEVIVAKGQGLSLTEASWLADALRKAVHDAR
jgi:hypothetical protein